MAEVKERVVYINGEFVPESQAKISVFDRGFRWGDAVYDVERTFQGKIFMLNEHLDRLYSSLAYTRIDPKLTQQEFRQVVEEVVERNLPCLKPNEDYGVTQVVSRGLVLPTRALSASTVVCYCEPLGFSAWAKFYVTGLKMITPATRRTPPQCLSPRAKVSNKMNHMVAQHEAWQADTEALALMLDLDGNVTESHGANFMFMSKGVLRIPNRRNVLGGVGMESLLRVTEELGIPTEEHDYTPFDVYKADEAFVTSTSYRLLPVVSLNGIKIGTGKPGPVGKQLLSALGEKVGLDIVDQALSHLPEGERRQLQSVAHSQAVADQ